MYFSELILQFSKGDNSENKDFAWCECGSVIFL